MDKAKQKSTTSSVRHTRAIQRDRSKRTTAAPTPQQMQERLLEIVHPATLAQVNFFYDLGLRERSLGLFVMLALVLEMIWRQVGSISELTRIIQREAVLWATPRQVSQQALSERLRTLPAELFFKVLMEILPRLQQRWQQRQRPLPEEIAWAVAHYTAVQIVDGSTLDALVRKVGLLRDLPQNPLAGKITGLLHLGSRLPAHIWYDADPQAHDQRFWPRILAVLQAGSLLLMDMGYVNFTVFAQLTAQSVTFITRAKSNLAYSVERVLRRTAAVHDSIVWIGKGETRQRIRLVEVLYRGRWYRYLSNELDPERLPTAYLVALYWQRWRIEDAYAIAKRLLGLAYFWCGSQNAVELQLWASWLLYAVLVDLTDAVAEALTQPFAALSMEMVYRSLYFFTGAYQRGEATDVVAYFAADAKSLGILKRKRKTAQPSPLLIIPALLTDSSNP